MGADFMYWWIVLLIIAGVVYTTVSLIRQATENRDDRSIHQFRRALRKMSSWH